jgi:hypothetical protein
MGACSAQKCSLLLQAAPLCFVNAFLGVMESPVQIRPSRHRSKAGCGFQLPAFGCNGSVRALPSIAPAKRSGVPCRASILTSDYWHSARPRAGSRPSPADSGELSSRSRGRRLGSGRQRLVLGNNSRRGRRRPAATTLSRLGPRRPATSTALAFRCSLPAPTVSTPICQLVAIQPQLRLSPTVTISTGWHPYARRQTAEYLQAFAESVPKPGDAQILQFGTHSRRARWRRPGDGGWHRDRRIAQGRGGPGPAGAGVPAGAGQ